MTYDGILGAYMCKDIYGRHVLLDAEKYLDIELQLDERKKKEIALEEQTKKRRRKSKSGNEKKIEEESENPF